ncbi:inorganic phosphate transporter [Mangrovibrevibacter kandeliae]|uniref:inorganic phosphate transporter n=1 Tax=Mangrovibrevibacter kandeliae TaxID=2968473 RepID=UPI002118E681|nr:inorganic phosphate transporter [Aurantimonas sp. CSK15Z-1]MCQ8784095.1 inorganic phosphate transporter [Aurantimonas sp. CSK15Z-1]
MADTIATGADFAPEAAPKPRNLDHAVHPGLRILFFVVLVGAFAFAGYNIFTETQDIGEPLAFGPFLFLGIALIIALAFEFVNGFHDTANAVATVIYTNSLSPLIAVVWSGFWNFVGVIVSSGAVAYAIVTLLPVELILNVGSVAGYGMIFALLIAALLWNLATWYVGIPNSSSHALIGSILGVGLANQLLSGGSGGTSGVDWGQATDVLSALLFSPLVGFVGALVLFFVLRHFVKNETLYREPEGDQPPPRGIRALLIFTCTAVSFAHGGNDGQKGMGLIMLILIGVAPTAYALNRSVSDAATPAFVESADGAVEVMHAYAQGRNAMAPDEARTTLKQALQARQVITPDGMGAMARLTQDVAGRVQSYGSVAKVPAAETQNVRNDMYMIMDGLHIATGDEDALPKEQMDALKAFDDKLGDGIRFIPLWVKIVVAIALGLGTMVGWKRIVVTVGERIGRKHLTYGMGASAELVAAATILLAEFGGMPVSTTHILSSGVAGAAVANKQGLQRDTVLRIASAWVVTLPAAMALSGLLYWAFILVSGQSLS